MEKLFWIDLEMTGLDVEKEVIIEVAVIVTDLNFNQLATYNTVIKQDQKFIDQMDEWNTKHHKASGLTQSIAWGKEPDVVEAELNKILDEHFTQERAVLAGNSISQDRLFINKYFKKFAERLHYRMLDVTSWKIMMNAKYKVKYDKKNTHRALDDIIESINEMKCYLGHVSPVQLNPP